GQVACVGYAARAGVRRSRAVHVDERDLTDRAALLGRDQLVERLTRIAPLGEQRQPPRAVAALGERLGRDRADTGLRPRARGSGVERAGLQGAAELYRRGVARDDRVRHGTMIHDRGQIVSARRSAIATVVRVVFARGMVGITEASATTSPSIPSTRPWSSTTRPIPQVPAGWK